MTEQSLVPSENYTLDYQYLDYANSGIVDRSYSPPFTTYASLSSADRADGVLYNYENDTYEAYKMIKLQLLQPTVISSLSLSSDCYAPAIMLVTATGAYIGLWSYSHGDIEYTSRESYSEDWKSGSTLHWEFDDLEVAYIVIGVGGGGYEQEVPYEIYDIKISPNLPGVGPEAFWTDFHEQYEA